MSINMKDLKDKIVGEKYYYMQEHITVNPVKVTNIHTGDLMIFRDDCIVLFYNDFTSEYTYTKLGRVTNLEGFVEALGTGDLRVIIRPATKQ